MVRYKVIATVSSLIGECPRGNKVGDRIALARRKVTGIKCTSTFNSIYPTMFAMRYGADLPWLKDAVAVVPCPDPAHCVTFEVKREKDKRLAYPGSVGLDDKKAIGIEPPVNRLPAHNLFFSQTPFS